MSAEARDPEFERAIREAYERPVPLEPFDEARLVHTLRSLPTPRREPAWSFGLGNPRVVLSPVAAAACVILLLGAGALIGARWTGARSLRATAAARGEIVQFAIDAPRASRVAVVGDFNGWDPVATPMKKLRSGETWTAAIAVPEGRYTYAFVIDGRTWMSDPDAPIAPGDGFGVESSVLVVQRSRSSS